MAAMARSRFRFSRFGMGRQVRQRGLSQVGSEGGRPVAGCSTCVTCYRQASAVRNQDGRREETHHVEAPKHRPQTIILQTANDGAFRTLALEVPLLRFGLLRLLVLRPRVLIVDRCFLLGGVRLRIGRPAQLVETGWMGRQGRSSTWAPWDEPVAGDPL